MLCQTQPVVAGLRFAAVAAPAVMPRHSVDDFGRAQLRRLPRHPLRRHHRRLHRRWLRALHRARRRLGSSPSPWSVASPLEAALPAWLDQIRFAARPTSNTLLRRSSAAAAIDLLPDKHTVAQPPASWLTQAGSRPNRFSSSELPSGNNGDPAARAEVSALRRLSHSPFSSGYGRRGLKAVPAVSSAKGHASRRASAK